MAPRVSVAAYLSSVLDHPPRNCGAFLCGWIEVQREFNPAPWVMDLDARSWLRKVRMHPAGLVGVADQAAARAGIRPFFAGPSRAVPVGAGAVVVVPASNGRVRQACAILDGGRRWTVISAAQGLIGSRDFTPLRIWVF